MLERATQIRSSPDTGSLHIRRAAAVSAEPESLPDLVLIERSRGGDTRAIEALIRRYGRRLFRVARSVLPEAERAESAVCEAYLAAFADLNRYVPTGRFAAWLTRLTLAQARAARAPLHSPAPATAAVAPHPPDGATASDERQPLLELERSIDALPEVFRVVFVLRVIEGVSGVETAASLSLNPTTVRTRLYRALRRLSPDVVAAVRARPALLALPDERTERIVRGVLAGLPQGSMLSISASPP